MLGAGKDNSLIDKIRKHIPKAHQKEKWALVLEGGAMRCTFTAGVLDAIQDSSHKVFDFVIGTSAGGVCAASYVADQKGRNFNIFSHYISSGQFVNFSRLLRGEDIMDLSYAIREVTQELMPLDFDVFNKSPIDFYATMTNIESGELEYHRLHNGNIVDGLVACCSLPYLTRQPSQFKDGLYVDGCVKNPLPYQKAIEMGATQIVVITTRPHNFRKKKNTFMRTILGRNYKKFPEIHRLMEREHQIYNEAKQQLEDWRSCVESHDKNIQVTIVAPPEDLPIDRISQDMKKLQQSYAMGLIEGIKLSNALYDFKAASVTKLAIN